MGIVRGVWVLGCDNRPFGIPRRGPRYWLLVTRSNRLNVDRFLWNLPLKLPMQQNIRNPRGRLGAWQGHLRVSRRVWFIRMGKRHGRFFYPLSPAATRCSGVGLGWPAAGPPLSSTCSPTERGYHLAMSLSRVNCGAASLPVGGVKQGRRPQRFPRGLNTRHHTVFDNNWSALM